MKLALAISKHVIWHRAKIELNSKCDFKFDVVVEIIKIHAIV